MKFQKLFLNILFIFIIFSVIFVPSQAEEQKKSQAEEQKKEVDLRGTSALEKFEERFDSLEPLLAHTVSGAETIQGSNEIKVFAIKNVRSVKKTPLQKLGKYAGKADTALNMINTGRNAYSHDFFGTSGQ